MNSETRPRIITYLARPETRLLVAAMLGPRYDVLDAPLDLPLLETLHAMEPDLLIVEMELPEISGLEIVCRVRKDPVFGELPVVTLGHATDGGGHKVALVAGCTGYISFPLDPVLFPRRIQDFLEGKKDELDLKEHLQYYRRFTEVLIEKLEQRLERLEKKTRALEAERERQDALTLQVLTSMAKLIETKDTYTRGHSVRVTRYALALAREVGLAGEDLKVLERAGQLHDIGKVSIDLKQIHKPGPLTPEEWALIRQHPETGHTILAAIAFLKDEALVVRHHHQRFEGYEKHPEIPRRIRLMASILTLADSYDAMTSQRSYNSPRSTDDALKELDRCSGTQFDPQLVKAFKRIAKTLEQDATDPPG